MIKYYDIEALSNRVRYAIRGTYLFGEDQIVVEYVMYINGSIFGNEILQSFTNAGFYRRRLHLCQRRFRN